jgi:hypothetical protein
LFGGEAHRRRHRGRGGQKQKDGDQDHEEEEDQLDVLLSRIPDVAALLAKNGTAFFVGNDGDNDKEGDSDSAAAAGVALTGAELSSCALQALVALSSSAKHGDRVFRWGEEREDEDEGIEAEEGGEAGEGTAKKQSGRRSGSAAAVGKTTLNRMMEILLVAPPPPPPPPPPLPPAATAAAQAAASANTSTAGRQKRRRRIEALGRARIDSATALVSNLTRSEAGAIEWVGRSLPDEAVFATNDASDADENKEAATAAAQEFVLPNKPTMELLLARFLNPSYVEPRHGDGTVQLSNSTAGDADAGDSSVRALDRDEPAGANDPYQHFASALMNATQVEAGRRFVLQIRRKGGGASHRSGNALARASNRDTGAEADGTATTPNDGDGNGWTVLQAVLPQLRNSNPIRRRAIAGTVRNCCLDPDFAWWLLNVVKVQSHVLYPLAGPEELTVEEKRGLDPNLWLEGPDKVREPDHLTRLYLVEAILFLAHSGRQAQETLRRERVPVVLTWAEMVEEYEDVSEKMAECLRLLQTNDRGSEEEERRRDEESDPDSGAASWFGAPSAASQIDLRGSYDDVD